MKFSVVGMVSGMLLTLSILVLLHQNGSIYPTRMALIGTLVLGLVIGILLPSLVRMRAVARAQRRTTRAAR